jgi:hypothetical protein
MSHDPPAVGWTQAGTQFLVSAQRRPWAGAAVAAFAALHVLALPLPILGVTSIGPAARGVIGVAAAALAAHVVAEAPSWTARAAAFVTGNSVVVAFCATDALGPPSRAGSALLPVACALGASVWTLLVPVLPPRPRALAAVEGAGLAALAFAATGRLDGASLADAAALAGLALVLGALTATEATLRARAGWGAVLGAALGTVHLIVALDREPTSGRSAATLAGAALAGALFGLLATVARSARSFSALPPDHASFTDFDGGRLREKP